MTNKPSRPASKPPSPKPPSHRSPVIPSPGAVVRFLLTRHEELRLLGAAVFIAFLFCFFVPAFATRANLVTMLADASVTGIASVGLFVVVLSGGIDLSIGALAGLAPLLGGLWGGHPGVPELLVLALLTGAGIGLVSGLLIVRAGLAAFAVTLGIDAMARAVAAALSTAPGRASHASDLMPDFDATLFGIPASLALLAGIAGVAMAYLASYRGGRTIVAIGSSRRAARAAGLDVTLHGIVPYVVSGVLATVAGLLSVTAVPSSYAITELGGTLTIDALAAVVLGGARLRGGRGSIPATLIGVAIVAMLRSGLNLLGIASVWQWLVIGLLILVGLLAERITHGRASP